MEWSVFSKFPEVGLIFLTVSFLLFLSFFFRGGGLVPIVNNEGANQPKSTCAV